MHARTAKGGKVPAMRLFVLAIALTACRELPPPPSDGPPPPPPPKASISAAAPPASSAPPPPFAPEKITFEGQAMGTHLLFTGFTTKDVDAAKLRETFEAAKNEIVRLEGLMTTWRPDSEVSRVNAAAGKEPIAVSKETFDVIAESVKMSERSEGTFDITFQSLHGLWKFDQDLDPHPPKEAELKARLPLVNYRNIKLDPAKLTVYLAKAGVKIGLGGIAKGYAVDAASNVLKKAGVEAFFVQAGGDLYTHGKKPDGTEWSAGIRDPRGPDNDFFVMLSVSDHAFSTAGDYERSYIVGGKRYHHIIDPRTGYPATACRSVTIWAPNAFLADAIDDAVFILGPEKGLKLVEQTEGVGAVVVDAKNNVYISKRLEGKLRFVHAPTDGI
jgi:thiamine biosynthesis lipoprotein